MPGMQRNASCGLIRRDRPPVAPVLSDNGAAFIDMLVPLAMLGQLLTRPLALRPRIAPSRAQVKNENDGTMRIPAAAIGMP